MSEPPDDRDYFFNRRTDKTIVSRQIPDRTNGQNIRIFSKIVDGEEGVRFATLGDELVLRTTRAGRYEIKATVVEDPRSIRTLTLQKFNNPSGPSEKYHFTLVGREIQDFIEFVGAIRTAELVGPERVHLTDERVRDLIVSRSDAARLFEDHKDLFVEIAETADLARDIVAVGYRRRQLGRFRDLLQDQDFFAAEQNLLNCTPEGVWQRFFEDNPWVFGYGLSYQFRTGLDRQKLEQTIAGHSVERFGRRVDALLKSRGVLSSTAFAEIKRHDTLLLDARAYRGGVWAPSKELVGAVSQVQATVQDAVEVYRRCIEPLDDDGGPTGERIFNVEPRSFVIAGRLAEFVEADKVNELKFRSFELYRRNLHSTEVLTFDEIYERAQFIVDQAER